MRSELRAVKGAMKADIRDEEGEQEETLAWGKGPMTERVLKVCCRIELQPAFTG